MAARPIWRSPRQAVRPLRDRHRRLRRRVCRTRREFRAQGVATARAKRAEGCRGFPGDVEAAPAAARLRRDIRPAHAQPRDRAGLYLQQGRTVGKRRGACHHQRRPAAPRAAGGNLCRQEHRVFQLPGLHVQPGRVSKGGCRCRSLQYRAGFRRNTAARPDARGIQRRVLRAAFTRDGPHADRHAECDARVSERQGADPQ